MMKLRPCKETPKQIVHVDSQEVSREAKEVALEEKVSVSVSVSQKEKEKSIV